MRSLTLIVLVALVGGVAAADPLTGAVGVSTAWQQRRDFGAGNRGSIAPELFGFVYHRLGESRFFLRPGARLGWIGLEQPEMPRALRFVEHDVVLALETAILFDWILVPSLTAGADVGLRVVSLEVDEPISVPEDDISGTELLTGVHLQLGLGFPMWRGRLVFEPFVRWEHFFGDDRIGYRFGGELSLRVF